MANESAITRIVIEVQLVSLRARLQSLRSFTTNTSAELFRELNATQAQITALEQRRLEVIRSSS